MIGLFMLLWLVNSGAATNHTTPSACPECFQTRGFVGAEWHPANASNSLWWSPAFFDGYLPLVDLELAKVHQLGLTALRVFLHNKAYDADPGQFLVNIDKFLGLAAKHSLGVAFVFFDDCWNHVGASTSSQCQQVPGIHNGCSMASPQDTDRTNTSRFEAYVSDVISAHAQDKRILWWGLYNELHRGGFSYKLRTAAFQWAKAIQPIAPITSCWSGDGNNDTQLQNIHLYNTDWGAWNNAISYGLNQAPRQGSLFSEAGCRCFQGSADAGSPLEVLNWLQALAAAGAYIPGVMLAWTISVGNDNTRWHWGSKPGTIEPAIPWCLPFAVSLSPYMPLYTLTLPHSHTLTINCTCCCDEIKRIQDQDFSCSFSDFVSLSTSFSLCCPHSHYALLDAHLLPCSAPSILNSLLLTLWLSLSVAGTPRSSDCLTRTPSLCGWLVLSVFD